MGNPLSEANLQEVQRVTVLGLLINLVLTLAKLVAGITGHSQAVVADAVHSLSDSATDIVVLVGARFWGKPADADHPYGHRKVESFATAFIGLALGLVGLGLGYNALVTMHEQHEAPPGLEALLAALASIVVKEWLYQWTIRVGKRVKSSAVIANAWHHRSDALSSIPVAVAVGTSFILPGWAFLDHVATVAVALFILQATWMIMSQPIHDLLERGVEAEVLQAIERHVRGIPGVRDFHKIRTRSVSSAIFVDLHVHVDAHLDIAQGHNIARQVKKALLESELGIVDVLVHIEPYDPARGLVECNGT
ncbi:MAG: Cobalt-zinc-cadmium resistance protein [Candidatus Ozemobacter sibiricus]|jgi:cation diffusion facilitator family transporter|uniref:Cobalt-zinc-cadmium resistance protein n=1 Tax=Candidatus Ozemobacter sibiricus TaxID=2268124 RepID=A0A367ZSU1_9BACT|nr:MAG: Cobalt-zinc-cadmium resistance protein [Candidatus Ozemobacter sibiricus]